MLFRSLYEGIVFSEAHPHKGTWQQIFENEQPLHVEIGMGRGRFIRTMAQERPEINFIGVEVVEEKDLFKQFGLDETIFWANGADIAPEWLYDNGVACHP